MGDNIKEIESQKRAIIAYGTQLIYWPVLTIKSKSISRLNIVTKGPRKG